MFRNSKKRFTFDLLNISYIKINIMKKVLFSAAVLALMAICNTGFAQDEKIKENDQ